MVMPPTNALVALLKCPQIHGHTYTMFIHTVYHRPTRSPHMPGNPLSPDTHAPPHSRMLALTLMLLDTLVDTWKTTKTQKTVAGWIDTMENPLPGRYFHVFSE